MFRYTFASQISRLNTIQAKISDSARTYMLYCLIAQYRVLEGARLVLLQNSYPAKTSADGLESHQALPSPCPPKQEAGASGNKATHLYTGRLVSTMYQSSSVLLLNIPNAHVFGELQHLLRNTIYKTCYS
jgi:hypothetical protein